MLEGLPKELYHQNYAVQFSPLTNFAKVRKLILFHVLLKGRSSNQIHLEEQFISHLWKLL